LLTIKFDLKIGIDERLGYGSKDKLVSLNGVGWVKLEYIREQG